MSSARLGGRSVVVTTGHLAVSAANQSVVVVAATTPTGFALGSADLVRTTRATIDGTPTITSAGVVLSATSAGSLDVQSSGSPTGTLGADAGDLARVVSAHVPASGAVAAARVVTDTQAQVAPGALLTVNAGPVTVAAGSALATHVAAQGGPGSVAALVVTDTTGGTLAQDARLVGGGDLTVDRRHDRPRRRHRLRRRRPLVRRLDHRGHPVGRPDGARRQTSCSPRPRTPPAAPPAPAPPSRRPATRSTPSSTAT